MQRPTLVIIGGANGSGKTTLAREFVALENFTYLGADEIARELNAREPEKVAIEAARLFSQKFGELLERQESFIVESTLAGLTLRKWIEQARSFDYAVKILFVYLDSPELCVQRVAARVAKGGHNVPETDIRRRYARANSNFWHVYRNLADAWSLFYNAGDNIIQVAGGDRTGAVDLDEERFSIWNEMVKKIRSKTGISDETLRELLENQRIATAAVHKAQEENRRLGVPNWYSINGIIVNEAELDDKNKTQK